jgi:TRAP-type C4-dicarboxylate transport system permease small subunit
MKFLTGLGKILDHMNTIMVILSAVFLLGLTFIVGADITLRYLFLRPLGWVKEVSEYILVALGFLVAAWILKDDGHVKMDLVVSKVSPKTQTLMNIITSAISTLVVLVIALFSARVTLQFYQTRLVAATVLEPQKWILLTPVFLGALLLAIQFLRRTFNLVNRWKTLSRKDGLGPARE